VHREQSLSRNLPKDIIRHRADRSVRPIAKKNPLPKQGVLMQQRLPDAYPRQEAGSSSGFTPLPVHDQPVNWPDAAVAVSLGLRL
jgi:hypothetical protein